MLAELTYAEFNECVRLTGDLRGRKDVHQKIEECHSHCTLGQPVGDSEKGKDSNESDEGKGNDKNEPETWHGRCHDQIGQIRIPGL